MNADPRPARALKPCGTAAAATRHRRHGEKPCEACRIAENLARRPNGPVARKPCGTRAAYKRHLRNGEPIDDACRRANTEARRAYNAARYASRGSEGEAMSENAAEPRWTFTALVHDSDLGCVVELTDNETAERFYGHDAPENTRKRIEGHQ